MQASFGVFFEKFLVRVFEQLVKIFVAELSVALRYGVRFSFGD